jgi:hypothetical protein
VFLVVAKIEAQALLAFDDCESDVAAIGTNVLRSDREDVAEVGFGQFFSGADLAGCSHERDDLGFVVDLDSGWAMGSSSTTTLLIVVSFEGEVATFEFGSDECTED